MPRPDSLQTRPSRQYGRQSREPQPEGEADCIPYRHHARFILQLFCRGQCREPMTVWCVKCRGGMLAIPLRVPEAMGWKWLAYFYHPACGSRFTMDGYSFWPDGKLM